MDLNDLLNPEDSSEPTPSPKETPRLPPEVEANLKALEEKVAKTSTQLDDMLATRAREQLLAQYADFKASRPDITDEILFGALEEKYQGYIKEGLTPQDAQGLVDRLYMNPVGWAAISDEITRHSAPKEADKITPSVASGDEPLELNRHNLGKFINSKGAKK